jgi:hypothetical protein
MISLPTVTVVCVTTKDYGPSILAIKKTLDLIKPYETIYFSDVPYLEDDRIHHIQIERFRSVEDYNHFIFKRLGDYLKSNHVLVIQHDGHPICAEAWTDEFLLYDYIGAPWTYTDGRNVGNGGFSLRSRRLHKLLQSEEFKYFTPEDEKICRYYRQTLERCGMIFAPENVAHRFSYEMHRPVQKTFGFHNYFHPPYREPVILKRSDSMGDIIMMEPVMAWFFDHGYRVILDTPRQYFNLFAKHYFQVEHVHDLYTSEPLDTYRTINLDMAYEIQPQKLVLAAYYHTCGISDGAIRNSKLNFAAPEDKREVKLFDNYIVLHTDDTGMAHRNVHGVDWERVGQWIEENYKHTVIRVGRGNGRGGLKINTYSENMLAYIVANADYFIGLDSGCAQIAVACDVPSMLFFGSVQADKRYADLAKIKVMSKMCPALKDGCYHAEVSRVGVDCEVDAQRPPCISWSTEEVCEQIKAWIL